MTMSEVIVKRFVAVNRHGKFEELILTRDRISRTIRLRIRRDGDRARLIEGTGNTVGKVYEFRKNLLEMTGARAIGIGFDPFKKRSYHKSIGTVGTIGGDNIRHDHTQVIASIR